MVPETMRPDDGVHRVGELISVSFTANVCLNLPIVPHGNFLQVNCDMPFWFDVSIQLDGNPASKNQFTVACQDKSLYLNLTRENVRSEPRWTFLTVLGPNGTVRRGNCAEHRYVSNSCQLGVHHCCSLMPPCLVQRHGSICRLVCRVIRLKVHLIH
jgi:hypothetical protein